MHAMRRTGYASTPEFEAVRLPYAGDASMVVLLPTSGTPSDLVATLTADDFDIEWGTHIVDVTLPSFDFEAEVALKDALMGLGMVEAAHAVRAAIYRMVRW